MQHLGLATLMTIGSLLPLAAQMGLSGQVIDESGRPLPFVVVTSRTSNGFLAFYTNLDGGFEFANRPHRRGHTLEFRSAGYIPRIVRLDGESDRLEVTLKPTSSDPATEWQVGLASGLHVALSTVDGLVSDATHLYAGESYTLVITYKGISGCTRPGPSLLGREGADIVVSIAVFTRNRDCGVVRVDHEHVFDVEFQQPGTGSIRAVGLYDDVVVPVRIGAAQPHNE